MKKAATPIPTRHRALEIDVDSHVQRAERLSGTAQSGEAMVHATLALVGMLARLIEEGDGD